jgi:hypothetical protein
MLDSIRFNMGGVEKTINNLCWMWQMLLEAQRGGVGGASLRTYPTIDDMWFTMAI